MMLSFVPPRDCSDAREQISLRLDAELPELDEARLDAHLAQCVACQAFSRDLELLTAAVRGTPLLEPARAVRLAPAPRRARRRLPRSVASAVSAMAAVAAAVGLVTGLGPSSPFTATNRAWAVRIVHAQLTLKEHQLDQLDSVVQNGPPRPVTPGTGPDPTTGV